MKKFGFTLLLLLTSNIYSETINGHTLPPEPDPEFISLTLESNTTSLNIGEKVQLSLVGTYKDNREKALTSDIEWIITPMGSVEVNGTALIVLKDVNTTVQAKVGNTLSNDINLELYWEADGHRLPPEPDLTVNNSTLLGIDSNDNGVRDDVERWIYETYDEYVPCHQELDYNNIAIIDGEEIPSAITVCEENPIPYHPIMRATAMAHAKAAQIIIQEPEKAKINKTYEILDAAQDCEISINVLNIKWNYKGKEYPIITKLSFKEGNGLVKKLFNTTQRARAYAKYNYYLSGGVYSVPTDEEGLTLCDENVKKLLKELK